MHTRHWKTTLHATNELPKIDKRSLQRFDKAIRSLEQRQAKEGVAAYDLKTNSIDTSALFKEGLEAARVKEFNKNKRQDAKAQGKLLSNKQKAQLKQKKAAERKQNRLAKKAS